MTKSPGSIVPVAPGLFRNKWLPRGRAEYLSTFEDGVKTKDLVASRDFAFGVEFAKDDPAKSTAQQDDKQAGERQRRNAAAGRDMRMLLATVLPYR